MGVIEYSANIWRLVWNATGTVLAASAEDGSISLWRKDYSGRWANIQNIPTGNSMSYFYSMQS
jgi:nucleoporin SEH1